MAGRACLVLWRTIKSTKAVISDNNELPPQHRTLCGHGILKLSSDNRPCRHLTPLNLANCDLACISTTVLERMILPNFRHENFESYRWSSFETQGFGEEPLTSQNPEMRYSNFAFVYFEKQRIILTCRCCPHVAFEEFTIQGAEDYGAILVLEFFLGKGSSIWFTRAS